MAGLQEIVDRRGRIAEILNRQTRPVDRDNPSPARGESGGCAGPSELRAPSHVLASRPMLISFQDLLDALEFVGSGSLGEHQAILCRRTGKIYWRSEFSGLDELNDELPDDIEDDEKYAAIPDKRELGLGKPLVLDFAREFLPDDFDEVRYMFSKKGGYGKFRALLIRRNVLERWYDFEAKGTEQALREWCELNAIEVAG
jgi:hypothetical protein